VAYFTPGEAAPTTGDLHAWLSDRLPPHMVPAAFVSLPALPLTPHGKVDVKALPAPDGARPSVAAAYAPPRSALERRNATVWQEILKVDQVGLHDNFFELGGNSLLAARVHARLREALQADLALLDMFKYPTVSALAQRMAGATDGTDTAREIQDEAQRRRAALGKRQQASQARLTRNKK
jgi:hypothetical protein